MNDLTRANIEYSDREEIDWLHRKLDKAEERIGRLCGAIRTALYETSDMTEMERVLEEALDA